MTLFWRGKMEAAILAALMHHKPDYSSPKQLDEAARIIADFIIDTFEKLDDPDHQILQ